MKQFKPIPSTFALAPTLARRIAQVREFRNMTVLDLANQSNFGVKRVEELESGLETWLSDTDRQRLAKALSIEPQLLKDVEVRAVETSLVPQTHMLNAVTAQRLAQDILDGVEDLKCPDCGSPLKTNVIDGFDIEGHPQQFAKAFCIKCPYVLRI